MSIPQHWPEPLYTRKAASAYLPGLFTPETMAERACLGKGPKFLKFDRQVRYPKSSLDLFVMESVQAMPPAQVPEAYLMFLSVEYQELMEHLLAIAKGGRK